MSDTDIENDAIKRNENSTLALSLDNEPHEPQTTMKAIDWSLGMKIYHTAVPCFLAFLM